jgi:uncharacterized alpha-E superfamily protein
MLSRVADSLYWLARHLERAEHTSRLIEVNLNLMLDQSSVADRDRWPSLVRAVDVDPEDMPDDPRQVVERLTFDQELPQSLRSCIRNAREQARQVRQQISGEMYEQLNAMFFQLRDGSPSQVWGREPYVYFRSLRQGVAMFHGITQASITHDEGYHFMGLGLHVERTELIARLLDTVLGDRGVEPEEGFEATAYLQWVGLLRGCAAYEPYQQRHSGTLSSASVLQFLLLAEDFPRSVRYSIDQVNKSLHRINAYSTAPRVEELHRLAGRLQSRLQFSTVGEFTGDKLQPLLADVQDQCTALHERIYRVYVAYPIQAIAA